MIWASPAGKNTRRASGLPVPSSTGPPVASMAEATPNTDEAMPRTFRNGSGTGLMGGPGLIGDGEGARRAGGRHAHQRLVGHAVAGVVLLGGSSPFTVVPWSGRQCPQR